MAYQSDRTGASIDLVLDNADAGNMGRAGTLNPPSNDADLALVNGVHSTSPVTLNIPIASSGTLFTNVWTNDSAGSQKFDIATSGVARSYVRGRTGGFWSPWRELTTTVAIFFSNDTQEQCYQYLRDSQRFLELDTLGVQTMSAAMVTRRGQCEAYLTLNPITEVEAAHDLIDLLP